MFSIDSSSRLGTSSFVLHLNHYTKSLSLVTSVCDNISIDTPRLIRKLIVYKPPVTETLSNRMNNKIRDDEIYIGRRPLTALSVRRDVRSST